MTHVAMMPVRRWTSAIFVLALSAGLSVADPINPADVHVIDGDTIRVAGWDGPRGWVRRAQARQPRPLRVTRSPSSRSHSRPNAALPGIAVSVNSLKLVTALECTPALSPVCRLDRRRKASWQIKVL